MYLAVCWRTVSAAVFVLLMSAATHVAALSFNEALALAVRDAPDLRSEARQIDAAKLAALPAGTLPDPKLILGMDNVPVSGSDSFSLTRDFMTMQRLGVMQVFPNQGKRKAEIALAQGKIALAEANEQLMRLKVMRETALAWIKRYTLEQQLVQISLLIEENRFFDDAVRAAIASGKGAAIDVVAPRQEAALLEEQRDNFESQRQQSLAILKRWVGERANEPIEGQPPHWLISYKALAQGLHKHPDLIALDPKTKVIEAELAEAQADKRPDFELEMAYQKRAQEFGDMVSVQLSVDLPLFAQTRKEPFIAAKQAERLSLEAERELMLREHRAELESELADYARLDKSLKRQRNVLAPLAMEKLTLALAAWCGAKGSLMDLVVARRENLELKLKTIALEGKQQQLAARLYYAYSQPIAIKPGEQP